jgi:hypothetical protein
LTKQLVVAGNLCRCGIYPQIIAPMKPGARNRAVGQAGPDLFEARAWQSLPACEAHAHLRFKRLPWHVSRSYDSRTAAPGIAGLAQNHDPQNPVSQNRVAPAFAREDADPEASTNVMASREGSA